MKLLNWLTKPRCTACGSTITQRGNPCPACYHWDKSSNG